jgi:hypothetical protein
MQPFSAADILNLWEHGAGLHAIDQALLVLRHALPECNYDDLADLPIGHRDGLLLDVHRRNFGNELEGYAECPECQERLEFSIACELLSHVNATEQVTTKTVNIDDSDFLLRCPNSRDLAAAIIAGDLKSAKQTLLNLCALRANGSGQASCVLPEATQAVIAAELLAIDPRAETVLDLGCPECGNACRRVFDITAFLWTEIRARARRLLQEVDALARAYGWSEADILGMSEARRALYVQMVIS